MAGKDDNRLGKAGDEPAGNLDTGKYERSIGSISNCSAHLQQNPNDCRILHLRAVSYELIGLYDQALADYKRIVEINELFRNAKLKIGELEQRLTLKIGKLEQRLTGETEEKVTINIGCFN